MNMNFKIKSIELFSFFFLLIFLPTSVPTYLMKNNCLSHISPIIGRWIWHESQVDDQQEHDRQRDSGVEWIEVEHDSKVDDEAKQSGVPRKVAKTRTKVWRRRDAQQKASQVCKAVRQEEEASDDWSNNIQITNEKAL